MRYKTNIAIAVLFLAASIGMFISSGEPVIAHLKGTQAERLFLSLHYENTIIFNLCVGIVGGVIVWFLNVFIPDKQMRTTLRNNLRRQYQYFKEDVIQIILGSEATAYVDASELSNPFVFREYFLGENLQRWHNVVSYLKDEPEQFSDVVEHIQAFTTEIDYTLKKIGIEDEKLHAHMKWILHHTRRLQHLSAYSPKSAAHHSDLLLEILAARDHRSGFYKTDPIEQMINSI